MPESSCRRILTGRIIFFATFMPPLAGYVDEDLSAV
jgi:hypothetical protein